MPVDPVIDNDALYKGIHAHDCHDEKFTTLAPLGRPVFSVVISSGGDIRWAVFDTEKLDVSDKTNNGDARYRVDSNVFWITSHIDEEVELTSIPGGYADSMTEITKLLHGHLPTRLHNIVYGECIEPSRGEAVSKSIDRMNKFGVGARFFRVYITVADESSSVCQKQLDLIRRLWAFVPSIVVQPVVSDFTHYYLNDKGFLLTKENEDDLEPYFLSNLIGCFSYCNKSSRTSSSSFLYIQACDSILPVQYTLIHRNQGGKMQNIQVQRFPSLASKLRSGMELDDLERYLKTQNYKLTLVAEDDSTSDDLQINSVLLEYRNFFLDAISMASKDSDAFQVLLSGGMAGMILFSLLAECKTETSEEFETVGEAKGEVTVDGRRCDVIFADHLCHSGVLNTVCNGVFVEKNVESESSIVGEGVTEGGMSIEEDTRSETIGIDKQRVAKYFDNIVYYGTVEKVETIHDKNHYLIHYDDGDREHVEKRELNRLLELYDMKPETKAEEVVVSTTTRPRKKAKQNKGIISASDRPVAVTHTAEGSAIEAGNGNGKSPTQIPSSALSDPSEFIGKRVAKLFSNDVYFGTVVKCNESDEKEVGRMWFVYYDDDDREDFELHDLQAALKL